MSSTTFLRKEKNYCDSLKSFTIDKCWPLTLRSHYQFSLLYAIQFLWNYFGEFCIRSTNNLLIDMTLQSHHLSAWCCKEIFCFGHSWHGSLMFSELIVSLMLCRGQLIINLNKRKGWKSWNVKRKKKFTITFVTAVKKKSLSLPQRVVM